MPLLPLLPMTPTPTPWGWEIAPRHTPEEKPSRHVLIDVFPPLRAWGWGELRSPQPKLDERAHVVPPTPLPGLGKWGWQLTFDSNLKITLQFHRPFEVIPGLPFIPSAFIPLQRGGDEREDILWRLERQREIDADVAWELGEDWRIAEERHYQFDSERIAWELGSDEPIDIRVQRFMKDPDVQIGVRAGKIIAGVFIGYTITKLIR